MLFIIPGFPFITSGIDLAKLDLRSGLERLTYSVIIVLVATMFAWIMALLLKLQPQDFSSLSIDPVLHLLLRLITSFCGVFGFSIMFNRYEEARKVLIQLLASGRSVSEMAACYA